MNKCKHFHMIPYKINAIKSCWDKNDNIFDPSTNIINAHFLLVTEYYCPECKAVIKINNNKIIYEEK